MYMTLHVQVLLKVVDMHGWMSCTEIGYTHIRVKIMILKCSHSLDTIFKFDDGYDYYRTYRYRQGSGTIWLDDLACTSSDLMLSTCSHSGFGNENCGHSEDVALSCGTSIPTSSTGK